MKTVLFVAALSTAFGLSNLIASPAVTVTGPGVQSFEGAFAGGAVPAHTPLVSALRFAQSRAEAQPAPLVEVTTHPLGKGPRTRVERAPDCHPMGRTLRCRVRLSDGPLPQGTVLEYRWLMGPGGRALSETRALVIDG